jgi:hypothetical protein
VPASGLPVVPPAPRLGVAPGTFVPSHLPRPAHHGAERASIRRHLPLALRPEPVLKSRLPRPPAGPPAPATPAADGDARAHTDRSIH